MRWKKISAFILTLTFVLAIPLSSAFAYINPSNHRLSYSITTQPDSYYHRESTRYRVVYSTGYNVYVCVDGTPYGGQYYSLVEDDGDTHTYIGQRWINSGTCATFYVNPSYLDGDNNKAELFIVADHYAGVSFFD